MKRINITILFILFLFPIYLKSEEGNNTMISPVLSDNINQEIDTSVKPTQEVENQDPEKEFKYLLSLNPEKASAKFLELMSKRKDKKDRIDFIDRNHHLLIRLIIELQKRGVENQQEKVINELENNDIGISVKFKPNKKIDKAIPKRKIEDNPINNMLEIRALEKNGDNQEAEQKIKELSQTNSSNSSVQIAIAEFYNEVKNFKAAETYSTKAIELNRENADAYKVRAISKYSINDVKGAIEDIKKASEIDPQDETSKLLTAIINSKKNLSIDELSTIQELKNALKDLKKEKDEVYIGENTSEKIEDSNITNQNNNQPLNYSKSQFYLKTAATKNQMQDYEGAIKYANLAIEKNPNNLEAYLERANSYNFLGKYDEAIRDTTFVINKEPSNIHALNMRAWSLYKKGLLDEANRDTTKALEIKPDFADAMFNRALSYEKQGRYTDMINDLKQAAELSPLYREKFHDAVAQYTNRIPNFQRNYINNILNEKKENITGRTTYKNFFILLLFTLSGGLLIGLGMLHIFSDKKTSASRITHPDTISPSVFYEGVATGKYKIIRKIGQGGMGTVYYAIDQTLNREVAVKKMNDEIKFNQREKQRFIEEARTVAMLHHPNIIEIYTIFEEDEDIYLVFEYIDGITLDKKLGQEIRMPFTEAKEIINEIGKALIYAHNKSIIHRDMKLSNVMISQEGNIKVMDFGLARIAHETMAKVTNTEIVGSPAYMAPEQDNGIALKESDIYSLSICLYEMLTGELPFNGPDYHYQKEKKIFNPLSQVVPGINPEIDSIMSKALEPDPKNRYKSVEDFLSDLNKLS